jgi:hypothetical protein
MAGKRSRRKPASPSRPTPLSYPEWKARAASALTGGPIAMTERQWRQLYIKGKSPAEAAREAEALHRRAFPAS